LKILWVKAGGLYPPNIGGRIRSYRILQALAKRHSIALFTFYAAIEDDLHSALEKEFDRVELMPLAIPAGRNFREALTYARYLSSPLPYTVSKFCKPEVTQRLLQLVGETRPDVIVCDFVIAAQSIPWDLPIPKIVFTHNVEAAIWRHHYKVAANPFWKLLSWREYRAMERFERDCLKRADHVLTVSHHDRDVFSKVIDPSRITVIPTGVDVDYFRPSPDREQPATLVFSGAMDWMPNEDAMVYFIKRMLPRIRKNIPNASLCVVGRNPSGALRDLAGSHQGIEVTGIVEDIRPFVHRAAVYVVPLRIGGGTRLKIFEAMAMGKAVVSTTIGAEGLPVHPGQDIVIADDPDEFADTVVRLLGDRARCEELGRAARGLVERTYSWNAVVQPFETVLSTLAGKN
jgi:sugar transferase (PEP-CTERM/EpsH1 system associated)